MVKLIMRWNGFNIYPALLSMLMLLSVTLAPLVHAHVDESITLVTFDYVTLPDEPNEHGHSHEVDEAHDSKFNHTHDHNPADHSHDVPGITKPLNQIPVSVSDDWRSFSAASLVDHLSFNIDRPPRI